MATVEIIEELTENEMNILKHHIEGDDIKKFRATLKGYLKDNYSLNESNILSECVEHSLMCKSYAIIKYLIHKQVIDILDVRNHAIITGDFRLLRFSYKEGAELFNDMIMMCKDLESLKYLRSKGCVLFPECCLAYILLNDYDMFRYSTTHTRCCKHAIEYAKEYGYKRIEDYITKNVKDVYKDCNCDKGLNNNVLYDILYFLRKKDGIKEATERYELCFKNMQHECEETESSEDDDGEYHSENQYSDDEYTTEDDEEDESEEDDEESDDEDDKDKELYDMWIQSLLYKTN